MLVFYVESKGVSRGLLGANREAHARSSGLPLFFRGRYGLQEPLSCFSASYLRFTSK